MGVKSVKRVLVEQATTTTTKNAPGDGKKIAHKTCIKTSVEWKCCCSCYVRGGVSALGWWLHTRRRFGARLIEPAERESIYQMKTLWQNIIIRARVALAGWRGSWKCLFVGSHWKVHVLSMFPMLGLMVLLTSFWKIEIYRWKFVENWIDGKNLKNDLTLF